jgi:hypothetical protein
MLPLSKSHLGHAGWLGFNAAPCSCLKTLCPCSFLSPVCPCRAQPAPKHIIYGATELLSGEEFLGQLSELGRKTG